MLSAAYYLISLINVYFEIKVNLINLKDLIFVLIIILMIKFVLNYH